VERQIDQVKLNLKIGDLNLDSGQQVKMNAARPIFRPWSTGIYWLVNHETVDDLNSHLNNVQAQYGAGMVPKADVLFSQVQLVSAEDSLIRARTSYENAVDNFNTVIKLPAGTEIALKDDLLYEKHGAINDECVEYALKNRPKMAAYQANVAIALSGVDVAKGGYLPTVSLKAGEDWYDQHSAGDNNNNWQISLTTSFNVLDAGLIASQVKEAKYALKTAKEQARQNRDTAVLNVRQVYYDLHETEKGYFCTMPREGKIINMLQNFQAYQHKYSWQA
jgi:outer membrane protein TolC